MIAIISLLASIVLVSLGQARAKARDSKRVQDLIQVRNALELFYSDFGYYPKSTVPSPGSGFQTCWDCNQFPIGGGLADFNFDTTKLGGGVPPNPPYTGDPPYYDGLETNTKNIIYLKPRPADPLTPPIGYFTGNDALRGYWYMTNGSDYKIAIAGTWEGSVAAIPGGFIHDPNFMYSGVTNAGDKNQTISLSSSGAKCWTIESLLCP